MKSFFISSTFRDMQEERDIIHRIVFPSVRNTLKKYGETAEEVDLRWGVDTLNLSEEDSGHMVIKVCIDAIDRCVPYFIVLLGERYGWIPEENLFEKFQDQRLEQFPKDISITEMEIKYGALSRDIGLEQCIFCFRNETLIHQIPEELRVDYVAESAFHKEKLDQLKAKIRSMEGANVLEYEASWDKDANKVCELDTFANDLEQLLIELLQREGLSEELLSGEEKISRDAELTMQQYLDTYVNREKAEQMLPIFYASGKSIWVAGESGSGKTAFLSFAVNQCRKKDMLACVYYGGNPGCQNVDTFLSWLSFELEKICGKKLREDNRTKRIVIKRIQNLSKYLTKPVMVFVDAVDQMSEDTIWTLIQLLKSTTKIQFLVSSTVLLWDLGLKEAEDMFISRKLERLTDTELGLIVSKIAGRRGKSLDAKVTKKIREKEQMYLPINLSLLLQRLFMMDGSEFAQAEKLAPGMEGISQYMQSLVDLSGETTDELLTAVVNRAMEIMGAEGGMNIRKLLGLLAAAPEGISLRLLSELCPEVSMLQIQQMLCFLYDLVEETEEGRWRYKHPFYETSICNILGNEAIHSYRVQLFERFKETREFSWSEYLCLGGMLKRDELAADVSNALKERILTDEQIWSEKSLYPISYGKNEERYICCILRGISNGALKWNEEIFEFLENVVKAEFTEFETLFYMYGALRSRCDVLFRFEKEQEFSDKQYQAYLQIKNVSMELFWDVIELCEEGCCSSDLERAKIWYQRLSKVENTSYSLYKETRDVLLVNSVLLWCKKYLDYKEAENEEALEELKKFFEANKTIYIAQDSLNMYEQESPGHNARCMEQLTVFSLNLSGIYLKNKDFPNAYPYARFVYAEKKKAYQLYRTTKTAEQYVWAAISLVRCMKEGSDARKNYSEDAHQVLDWLESICFTPKVGEWKRYLHSLNNETEKALKVSRRLKERYPENDYDEFVLFDLRKHKDALKQHMEHASFHDITSILSEIEAINKDLYGRTQDEYFLDLLHEWSLDMLQAYTWQEMYQDAEQYLHQAETYLQCDYIQKGRARWLRELFTAVNGLVLYYRKGEKEQLAEYMRKAELLLEDTDEKNKNRNRQQLSILWSGRILYMKTRLLWEETHNPEETHALLNEYFEQYGNIVDENEQRPAHFLLAELKAFEGSNGEAIIGLKKCCMRGEKNMGWQMDFLLSEYEVWQFLIAAKASLMIYDIMQVKEQVYLNKGLRALNSILKFYTRSGNAAYRKTAGGMLAEYFMKYRRQANEAVETEAAEVLLEWMAFEAENRMLAKAERELVGECLTYRADFDANEWSEEDEKSCKWILYQSDTYPDDLLWNDRANRFLIKKALCNCLNDDYETAMELCETIRMGLNEKWTRECEILLNVCRARLSSSIMDIDILEAFCTEIEEKKEMDDNDFWIHMEALIAIGHATPEKAESCFRKVSQILEKRYLDNKKGTPRLWKRDYVLREKCLKYSQLHSDNAIYLEDLMAVRMAWANISGYDKESNVRLVEWDGKIARAYEGIDEKLEWKRWETVCSILKTYLVKKDVLNANEMELVMAFYFTLLQKMNEAENWSYYTVNELFELALETTTRLYHLTEDERWLKKAFRVIEVYRMQMNSPKLLDNRSDFRKEKTAESYIYDLDVYQIYLENGMEQQILDQLVETIKTWISCIPGYYKELITFSIGALKRIDEYLEGRSLEIKALMQTVQLNRDGDSNEIFWFIRGLYGKHGTNLSLDELKELYEKERLNFKHI